MRITTEGQSGSREQIEFKAQRKYSADRVATFLSVLAPAEDTNKALLAVERPDQPTEAFSYLAGLKKAHQNQLRQISRLSERESRRPGHARNGARPIRSRRGARA